MNKAAEEKAVQAILLGVDVNEYPWSGMNYPEEPTAHITAILAAYRAHLASEGLVIVPVYDPKRSLLHPLTGDNFKAIGAAYEHAQKRHGYTETWMAVYNECIRQGIKGPDHTSDEAREKAMIKASGDGSTKAYREAQE